MIQLWTSGKLHFRAGVARARLPIIVGAMTFRSLPALQQVLAWATEQGMTVRDQLSEEQLAALERAFTGKDPWRLELYPALRAFGYALSRLSLPDLPALLNVGDVLVALEELCADTSVAWPSREAVAEGTFAELGYASASAAITRARDANAAAWREHALNNKQLLLRGAERVTGRRGAVRGARGQRHTSAALQVDTELGFGDLVTGQEYQQVDADVQCQEHRQVAGRVHRRRRRCHVVESPSLIAQCALVIVGAGP